MKRRNFLSLLGAATLAPALPSFGGAPVATAAAGYNRYMYGLGVFQARTRTGLTAADLMAQLKLNSVQANAMMGEMNASGVFTPITSVVRVAARQTTTPRKPYIRKALREVEAWVNEQQVTAQEAVMEKTDTEITTPPELNQNEPS